MTREAAQAALRPSMDLIYDCLPAGQKPSDRPSILGRMHRCDIDAILAATDIVALIGETVELRKAGTDYQACCPFHDEKTASFTVSPSKQFYHCFGCGAHGDALTWVQEYDRLSFRKALEALAGRAGMDLQPEDRDAVRAKRNKALRRELESAVYHELLVLTDAIGERVAFREIDAATRQRYPHIQQVPEDPSEREFTAAKRIAKALHALYGVTA
jgi:DNA primase